MRTRTFATLFAITAALGLSACDKKEAKPADKKAEAKKDDAKAEAKKDLKADEKADEAKADGGEAAAEGAAADGAGGEPAAAGSVKLTKLGLEATVPGGTSVGDAAVGEGVMVQGDELMATVEEALDTRPKTAEDAAKGAVMYTPKNLEIEMLEDGWAMAFDNEGGMGANYFVQVRREIGGKSYWCETTASKPEQQAAALAFCKSLAQ